MRARLMRSGRTKKAIKLCKLLSKPYFRSCLIKGVAAGTEHTSLLIRLECRTVVDIGANKGQFAVAVRARFPQARIFAFEPLSGPAKRFRLIFSDDELVRLYDSAIGPRAEMGTIYVSARDDSSSLLPITDLQNEIFPGTSEVGQETVRIGTLREFVQPDEIKPPALLKIDVQGYELEALKGCECLLDRFAYIYVECSFVELYSGQASVSQVIDFLHERGFVLKGIYNITYDRSELAVQADFFFERSVG